MADEKGIAAGSFRTGTEPMQVVSGKFGDFEVQYEAPPSKDLPEMIAEFFRTKLRESRRGDDFICYFTFIF